MTLFFFSDGRAQHEHQRQPGPPHHWPRTHCHTSQVDWKQDEFKMKLYQKPFHLAKDVQNVKNLFNIDVKSLLLPISNLYHVQENKVFLTLNCHVQKVAASWALSRYVSVHTNDWMQLSWGRPRFSITIGL